LFVKSYFDGRTRHEGRVNPEVKEDPLLMFILVEAEQLEPCIALQNHLLFSGRKPIRFTWVHFKFPLEDDELLVEPRWYEVHGLVEFLTACVSHTALPFEFFSSIDDAPPNNRVRVVHRLVLGAVGELVSVAVAWFLLNKRK